MKKTLLSIAGILCASVILLTSCSFDKTGSSEPVLEFVAPTFKGGENYLAASDSDIGVTQYLYMNDSKTGKYIANQYVKYNGSGGYESVGILDVYDFEYDSKSGIAIWELDNDTYTFIQLIMNDSGKPSIVSSPICYRDEGESGLYTTFATKDNSKAWTFKKNGKVDYADGSQSATFKYTNDDGIITVKDDYGKTLKLYYYDNGMICYADGIFAMPQKDEIEVGVRNFEVYYGKDEDYKYFFDSRVLPVEDQINYFEVALRDLPKNIKKTICIADKDARSIEEKDYNLNIAEWLGKYDNKQSHIYLDFDSKFGYGGFKDGVPESYFSGLTCLEGITLCGAKKTTTSKQVVRKNAFENCSNLKYVYVSSDFNEIGGNAFKGCDALEEVNFEMATKWYYVDDSTGENNKLPTSSAKAAEKIKENVDKKLVFKN